MKLCSSARTRCKLERHWRILNNISFHGGRCWPLDLALWDLAGKITGQPCWKLIGGLSDRVRAYASSGTLRGPETLAERGGALSGRGFRGDEDPLPSRRLARRHPRARGRAQAGRRPA